MTTMPNVFCQKPTLFCSMFDYINKKFHFWTKDFYFKVSVWTRRMLSQQLGQKLLAKSLIGFGTKYENEHQKKYFSKYFKLFNKSSPGQEESGFKNNAAKFPVKKIFLCSETRKKTKKLDCFKKVFRIH